jgi:glucokinase
MLLAGDVGGTKTTLGVFARDRGPREPLAVATFPSRDYASLEALVRDFLTGLDLSVDHASFGVPGPVVGGRAAITNLPWELDEVSLRAALGLRRAVLVNDLEAIAHAVPIAGPEDLATLNEGLPEPTGAVAIVAPGTGLGEAFLTWDGLRLVPHPSEGGHADFAPGDLLQVELVRYLLPRYSHVSRERVCSGRGIPNLYAFLRDSGRYVEPDWLADRLADVDDPTPVIASAALDAQARCDICVATLDMFVSILGAEAGNLALSVLATRGVYLGGGIPRRILPALTGDSFLRAFRSKGRMSSLLARVPVHVITNPQIALIGAAFHGLGADA